ncbi:MAG: hypothetical protein WDN48_17535 [Pseudolabrys sp.]
MTGIAAKRADAALAMRSAPEDFDVEGARRIFSQMIAGVARPNGL